MWTIPGISADKGGQAEFLRSCRDAPRTIAPMNMDLTTFQAVQLGLQTISSMAIAGGLIFTAVQVRRSHRATYVSNYTRLVEMQNALRKIRVDSPSLAYVHSHDVEGLVSDDDIRDHFLNLMQLAVFEIIWFSHLHGQIPHDYWESWERRMKDVAAEPSFRRMLASPAMKIMHDDFEKYIRGVVDQVHERHVRIERPD